MGIPGRQIENYGEKCPRILCAVLILFSHNTLIFGTMVNSYTNAARYLVQMLVLIYLFCKLLCGKRLDKGIFGIYLILMICMLASFCFHMDMAGASWLLVCTIAFLLVSVYDNKSIVEAFERVMFVICSVDLLGYAMLRMNLDLLNSSIWRLLEKIHLVYEHSATYSFYVRGIVVLRAYAVFREPGVYQIFIICALLSVSLLVKSRLKWLHQMVYVFACLATGSTTGVLCLGISALIWVVYRIRKEWSLLYFGGIFALVGSPAILYIVRKLLVKFTQSESIPSWLARKASVTVNGYLWLENPFVGVGVSALQQRFTQMSKDILGAEVMDDTNTFLIFFAVYGTIVGILFIAGTYLLCKKMAYHKFMALELFVVIVCLYFSEALNSSVFPYILLFLGVSSQRLVEYGNEDSMHMNIELNSEKETVGNKHENSDYQLC